MDDLTFEAERAISYIHDLSRQINRLEETSHHARIKELEGKIVELEKTIATRNDELRSARLKIGQQGLEIGVLLNKVGVKK